jgi:hypothetical protein
MLVSVIVNIILPPSILEALLIPILPGFMRSVMFLIWMILFIIPMSRALQEIRIGQWELFLANNVKTRDILVGTFVGQLPIYGLLILYIAPPLFSAFFLAFKVHLFGQVLTYSIMFLMVLTTIWLSNVVTAAIQAKLGESSRGKDIANGFAIILAIVTIIPIYGIMFFSQQLSTILGLNVFLLLPFTWPADVISWITILSSQIGLSPVHILNYQQVLQLDVLISSTLVIGFTLACIGIGLAAADRVFTYNLGARTEQIITIKGEKLLFQPLRRISPGSFGALLITCFKDFFRKASNLSRIAYGVILATSLPFIMFQMSLGLGYGLDMMSLLTVAGAGMGVSASFAFSGTAFMESKDQLWIIQSTPSGTKRFIKARVTTAFIIAIPLSILPAIITMALAGGSLFLFLFLFGYGYIVTCGAIMFSIGVTTINPHYENMKSPEHQSNVILSTMGVQFALFVPTFGLLFSDMFGLPLWDWLRSVVGMAGIPIALSVIGMVSLLVIGRLTLSVGTKRITEVAA